jgi:hypothetical protein
MSLTNTHYYDILLNMSKRNAHFNLISPSLKTAFMRFLSTDLVNSQQSTVNSQQSTVNSQQSTVNSQQSTNYTPNRLNHVNYPVANNFLPSISLLIILFNYNNKLRTVQEERINHGGHVEPTVRIPRSFDTKIFYSSVKLQAVRRTAVLRGKKFFIYFILQNCRVFAYAGIPAFFIHP